MSLLPNQTNISQAEYFFLLANMSTANAGSISTGTLTASLATISSLIASNVSSAVVYASTLSTTQIDLDGQTLNATPTELLLNGIPLATTANISSLADWSYDPAVSTVQMNGNDLNQANTISSVNVRAGNGFFQNLVAFNSLFVSTATSTISSVVLSADSANISSFENEVGSISSLTVSSINGIDINALGIQSTVSTFQTASVSSFEVSSINGIDVNALGITVSTFADASISSLTTSSINGFKYDTVANWANYPANNNVNMNGFDITTGCNLNINSYGLMYINTSSDMRMKAESVYINADEGSLDVINTSLIQLSTTNGKRGEIDLIANEGNVLGGKITLTANGVDLGGLLYGGVIEITANTGGGFIPTPAFTSAVRINGASILEYSGATNSIGSVAGYGFYHGDLGINITAGVPPLAPNDPLTVYLYGTNGVLSYSPIYVKDAIRPYSDLTNNPQDLYIEDWSNGLSHGWIQLRGVSTATFSNNSAIQNLNTLNFASGIGAITSLSSLNGYPIGELINVSSISSLNEWSYYPALSTIDVAGNNIISCANLEVSSINNLAYPPTGAGSSTFVELFASSCVTSTISCGIIYGSADYIPGISPATALKLEAQYLDLTGVQQVLFQGNLTASSFSTYSVESEFGSVSSLTVSSINGQEYVPGNTALWATFPAVQTVNFSTNGNATILNEYGNISITAIAPVNIYNYNGGYEDLTVKSLYATSTLDAVYIVNQEASISTLSTGIIKGANASIYGLPLTGLAVEAPIVYISTGQLAVPSLVNASSISAFGGNIRNAVVSTLTASTILTSNLSSSQMFTSSLTTNTNTVSTIFCTEQLFLGANGLTGVELVFIAPNADQHKMDVQNQDRQIRYQKGSGAIGYFLDTSTNPPFISTLNNASTAVMAYFPSTNNSTIGVSSVSLFPAPLPLQMFGVSTFQATAFAISLPRNYTATNYGIQITPFSNTTNVPHASSISVSSFLVHAGGGASIGIPFYWQTIGMNY